MDQNQKLQGVVDFLELRQLLVGLRDNPALNVCFRHRLSGQMWSPNFSRVLTLTEKGAALTDATTGKVLMVLIEEIVQFELDDRFQVYQPHYHYDVRPGGG